METKLNDIKFTDLEQEVRRIVFKSIMDTGNYKPDDKMINYISSETISLCKEQKYKNLMFGDLSKIFEMGMSGDFNTSYSKESLNMKNISFWFSKFLEMRAQARMAGRDKEHTANKHKDKQTVFSGKANTPYGRATAFFCKLEADLVGKYSRDELRAKFNRIDHLRENKHEIGLKITEVEQRITEELKHESATCFSSFKKQNIESLAIEKAYKELRNYYNI